MDCLQDKSCADSVQGNEDAEFVVAVAESNLQEFHSISSYFLAILLVFIYYNIHLLKSWGLWLVLSFNIKI